MSQPAEPKNSTLAEKPFLARLSIAMFATVMGIGGLASAWAAARHIS